MSSCITTVSFWGLVSSKRVIAYSLLFIIRQENNLKKQTSPKHGLIEECAPIYHNPPHQQIAILYTMLHYLKGLLWEKAPYVHRR